MGNGGGVGRYSDAMRVFFAAAALLFGNETFAEIPDYRETVLPIMKQRCWECHSNENEVKGNLALDDLDEVRDYQIGPYNIIRPGDAEESVFFERLLLDANHNDFMPRDGDRLPEEELEIIKQWIVSGAIVDSSKLSEEEKEWLGKKAGMGARTETAPFQVWTNREGKEIKARFIRLEGDQLTFEREDGELFTVPLSMLSEESAVLAREAVKKTNL